MERMVKSFDGVGLYSKTEIPAGAKAIAVIVHGLAEHQGRYDYVAEQLNAAGIGTYRWDHRGHGRSEGERTYYSDFNELLDDTNVIVDLAIAENPDLPVFLIGHSMGGFTVSLYGAKYKDKAIRGIVTSGALTHDFKQTIGSVPEGLDVHARIPNELGDGVCSVKEVVDWYVKDPYNCMDYTFGLCYALSDGIKWFRDQDFAYPVLMLHGEKDALVDVKDTYAFFEKVSSTDKQMKIYGNLFHEIFNEYCKDEVVADVIQWILKRA